MASLQFLPKKQMCPNFENSDNLNRKINFACIYYGNFESWKKPMQSRFRKND